MQKRAKVKLAVRNRCHNQYVTKCKGNKVLPNSVHCIHDTTLSTFNDYDFHYHIRDKPGMKHISRKAFDFIVTSCPQYCNKKECNSS